MSQNTGIRDSLLRGVAVIGLIAVLVLGAWGIVQLVVNFPNFFTHESDATETVVEKLTVSMPSPVTSGTLFPLSWSHTGKSGNYAYSISYSCADGLSFAAPTPAGTYQQVPCDTAFNYTNATDNTQLVAVLEDKAPQIGTIITVNAIRLSDSKVTMSGSSAVTVTPRPAAAASATTTTKPATTKPTTTTAATSGTYTASGQTSNLYGSPDLSVRMISVQPINGRYSAQFAVENVGTNVAAYGWEFNAQLPTNPPYTFVSQPQQKLYPGDKIVYTLGFDMPAAYGYANFYPYYGTNTLVVTVDPQNLLSDSNRGNNTASTNVLY